MAVMAQTPPLRVVRGFYEAAAQTLVVHLHNLSGGVLSGDRFDYRFDIGSEASVLLTSTGATRVYRAVENEPAASISTVVNIGENALLEYVPDPLLPFAGCRFAQDTSISLDKGAGLLWWDILAPGREASGELFAYRELRWRFAIDVGGRAIAAENVRLRPACHSIQSITRLGGYRYVAAVYICREGVPRQTWLELETRLSELALNLSSTSDSLWGVSALTSDGLLVRGLTKHGSLAILGVREFWTTAKLRLYGRPFLPPRKIY